MTRAWLFPGQGSQHPDMGAGLFDRFPALTATAAEIIGVDPRDLCADPRGQYLNQTRYVQPAVFVVSALAARAAREDGPPPDVVAGHSLGEYAALHAAGCLDFRTALRLVVRRGELMSAVTGGGMVAVLGLPQDRVTALLDQVGDVDLANHNLADQFVLAGSAAGVRAVIDAVRRMGTGRCVPLAVSVPAHSRFMADTADAFAAELRDVRFSEPSVPVLSNVTARPHDLPGLPGALREHFVRPVRWWDTLCRLARDGVREPAEIGPGDVLTKMWARARPALPVRDAPTVPAPTHPAPVPAPATVPAPARSRRPGSADVRARYDIGHACLAGSLDDGVSSPALLRRLAAAGVLGFYGAAGLEPHEIDAALNDVRDLSRYGMAWPTAADQGAVADRYVRAGVRHVEVTAPHTASARALARYRFGAGHRNLLVRVGDPATAERFLRPAEGTAAPLATDVAVTGDAPHLVPAVVALRDRLAPAAGVGVAGVGTPAAVAAAFALGADFVLTTSINQCTPEAATSDAAKDLLAALDVTDTRPAPGPDLFELGVRYPVARKGTLYAARAEHLYRLYLRHDSLEDLPPDDRAALEHTHFGTPLDRVWSELAAPARDARHRMALVFAEYCRRSTAAARRGVPGQRWNFRVPTGADMGAFNRHAAGGPLADWRDRHGDVITTELMDGAARVLARYR